MKRILILIPFLIIFIVVNAQRINNVNKWIKKGEKAENKNKFQKAIKYYKLVEDAYSHCDSIDGKLGDVFSSMGSIYYDLDEYLKAIEYAKRSAEIRKVLFGEQHQDYASSLSDLSFYYSSLDDYSKAIDYGTKAMEIRRQTLGENNPDYASSLNELSDIYINIGNYSKALEYGSKAVDINRTLYGENNPDYAFSLFTCAKSYCYLGDYSKALEYGNKAVEIYKNHLGDNNIDYATLLEGLAIFYSKIDENSKAIEYENKVMEIRKSILGEKHILSANSLSSLAVFNYRLGIYSKAVEYENRAMEIRKTILGENHSIYAASLNNLGLYYSSLGDELKAIEFENQAIKIIKNIYGDNHPDHAESLCHLGDSYFFLGYYSDAIQCYTEALDVLKIVYGGKHPDYATILLKIADYYSYFGDYSKALEYCKKAIEIDVATIGKNHTQYASTLKHCALLYSEAGKHSTAIELGKKSLEIKKSCLGEQYQKHPDYATSLNDLAFYYSDINDYSKAIEYATKAVEIDKKNWGENHSQYAISLGNLAMYFSKLGKHFVAIEHATKAMNIFKSVYGENNSTYARFLKKLSICYFNSGNYSKAIEYFKKYILIERNEIVSSFTFLPTFLRTSFWNKYSEDFIDIYPTFYYKSQCLQPIELYNQSALFAKGLLLSISTEIDKLIHESENIKIKRMFDELRFKKMELQKLYEKPINERFVNIDSLQEVIRLLEMNILERSKEFGDYTKKIKVTWQDIQQSLSEDELSVEFLSFNINGTDSTMVTALTLRKDDIEPKFIPLFEIKQLKDLGDTVTYICPDLTSLVWKPLQDELQGIKTIYFSPSGVLHKIGIEYAPEMNNYEMYRLSSTREIIELKKDEENNKKNKMAVLYGGIDYDASLSQTMHEEDVPIAIKDSLQKVNNHLHRAFVDSLNLRDMTIDYLPNTLIEVQNISTTFKKASYPNIVYLGAEATEASLKKLSGKAPSVLHISTHGFYFSEHQARKKDYFQFTRMDQQRYVNYEDKALSRSGLLMAGVSQTIKDNDVYNEKDDGILTAMEIAQLNLRGTELVVLSACETAKGDIMQGEGVFGLQRGFKKAGVKSIIMSLWKVNDLATEILMTEFYNNYCNGKGKRESLRLAQKKIREYKDDDGVHLFDDPFYWAGFIILD